MKRENIANVNHSNEFHGILMKVELLHKLTSCFQLLDANFAELSMVRL